MPCSPTSPSTSSPRHERWINYSADNRWGFQHACAERCSTTAVNSTTWRSDRGTLSEEERYKINEHIVQTLIMLSDLPFPKHLRQVPEIAGGHHEKMDGSGYPRGLQARGNEPSGPE
jgi:hypothetical protein